MNNMMVVIVALLTALLICVLVICKLLDMLDEKDSGVEDLLEENNELRLRIGELMCKGNVSQQIGRWSA